MRRVVKVATDITAEKLKNAEFEAKMNAISLAQAVIEFTPAGEIITANDNFSRDDGLLASTRSKGVITACSSSLLLRHRRNTRRSGRS